MILIFLGSWRSTLIIAVSIPLSILTSIIVMSALGETINIMTLGGLALAVGILVDDATVEIENINRNIDEGKEIEQAILDGAQQIAVPAFVSTLCHLHRVSADVLPHRRRAVSVRSAGGGGGIRHARLLLAFADAGPDHGQVFAARPRAGGRTPEHHQPQSSGADAGCVRAGASKDSATAITQLLERCLHHRAAFLWGFVVVCVGSFVLLVPWLGRDFFPQVDAGQIQTARARAGRNAD